MPSHRQGFAIAAYQNKIYVIGGWNSTNPNTGIAITLGTNEMYDPATDSWAIKAPLPIPTANLQANVVNNKIYVISGMSDIAKPTLSRSNWVYDTSSDSWSPAAPIPTAVFNYASAVVDNKIYIEGGGLSGSPYYSNLNQIYDPKTNSWTLGKPLPASLLSASAGSTTGVLSPAKLYVIGGTNNGYDGINTTQIYDPQTDNWTLGAAMPTARKALTVAVVNDTVYAFGGVSGSGPGMNRGTIYAIAEQYIPLDYQGPTPSTYIPTPSPYSTSTPTPTPTLTPSPSPPEFTAKFAASSIEVTIKNQPLGYVDTNGSNPSLYYGFRLKDHENIQDWNYAPIYYVGISSYGSYYKASASDCTVVSFPLGSYPLTGILSSGQVDLQVMALIGNEVPTNYENGTVYGFDGVTSNWSDIQTITIPVSSNSPTATSTTSIQGWVAAVTLIVVLAVVAGLLVYFKKHIRGRSP